MSNNLQRGKNAIHGLQALIIFISWVLTIAVFTKTGQTDGRSKYYFTLCLFCIPALIYQTAVPIFERTRKFVNPYAFAIVDILLTILWFAALIAVAAWTNSGIKAGEVKGKGKGGCAAFAYGPDSKCTLSRATVWTGVLIFFLFIATTGISIKNLLDFRRTGVLPGPTRASGPVEDDQTKYAFSANPHDDLDEDLEDHSTARPPRRRDDDQYALLHTDTEDGTHPGRPLSWGREHSPSAPGVGQVLHDADTSYHGGRTNNHDRLSRKAPANNPFKEHVPPVRKNVYDAGDAGTAYPSGDPFRDDLALSHGPNGGGGRVNFPEAEYHR